MTCPECGNEVAVNNLAPHRCLECGAVVWPDKPEGGAIRGLLIVSPVVLLAYGALAICLTWPDRTAWVVVGTGLAFAAYCFKKAWKSRKVIL